MFLKRTVGGNKGTYILVIQQPDQFDFDATLFKKEGSFLKILSPEISQARERNQNK